MPPASVAAAMPDFRLSLLEVADKLLDRGVVIAGGATISVAGVDLIFLGLNAVLTAVENLEQGGAAPLGPRAGGPRGPTPAQPPAPGPTSTPAPPSAYPLGPGRPAPRAEPAAESDPLPHPQVSGALPGQIDVDPERVEQGLAKLVLTLLELLRQLLERQGVRRMEGGSLTDEEVERMGLAFMRLEERIRAMARQFGLDPDDLNVSLGPLGDVL